MYYTECFALLCFCSLRCSLCSKLGYKLRHNALNYPALPRTAPCCTGPGPGRKMRRRESENREKKNHRNSGSGHENHTEYERRGSKVAERNIVETETNTKIAGKEI